MSVVDEIVLAPAGNSIRCLTIGSGRPLLLCHGFLSSAEEFGGRFGELARHRQLIVPDLPGNGSSAPLNRPHTVESMAMAMEGLLDVLGIKEFDVAGLCLGASVACALARRCGDRVDCLVLHTPLIAPALIRRFYREQVRVLTTPPLWQGVVALSRNRLVSDLYKRFVIAEGDVDPRTSQVNFENQRRANPAAAREWLRDGARQDDLEALLARRRPTLVIVAAHDQAIDVERLRGLVTGHPNIHLYVDAEQGHGWNSEAVHRQLGVMRQFFEAGDCLAAVDPPRSEMSA
jgi:pimeloyl-ACP methyl ester carboxylesterase